MSVIKRPSKIAPSKSKVVLSPVQPVHLVRQCKLVFHLSDNFVYETDDSRIDQIYFSKHVISDSL